MKRAMMFGIAMLLCGTILALASPAAGIEGLPGSTWGTVSRNVNGLTGSGGMGYINQGIDWMTLPGGIMLNTFAEYRYRARTKENDYYDAQGPALGIELKKWMLHLGAAYYWEYFPRLGEHSNSRELYVSGYEYWDLLQAAKTHPMNIIGLPGFVWARITRDIEGLTGSGVMGHVNQGIDWMMLPGGITLNTYAEYRFRARSKQKDYYDANGPALGVELKKTVLRLGADYYWERYPVLGEHSNYLEVYLTWYVDWDLKPLIK